jgi:hypothetical protein
VICEGGVAATPLQVKHDAQLNKSEGQTVSMRHRIAIGPNRQASLQAQNYNMGSRCRSMATSREFTGENAVQCISMRVCNTLLSACAVNRPAGRKRHSQRRDSCAGRWFTRLRLG